MLDKASEMGHLVKMVQGGHILPSVGGVEGNFLLIGSLVGSGAGVDGMDVGWNNDEVGGRFAVQINDCWIDHQQGGTSL